MYYAKYPDGACSVDFYNWARADNHTKVLLANGNRWPGIASTEAVDAFK